MTVSKDFSEIEQAAKLLRALFGPVPSSAPEKADPVRDSMMPKEQPAGTETRADRLEAALELLCRRGGFNGAVLADAMGLPLAVMNSPVDTNALAAFTTVLGDAIDKAGRLLNRFTADNISMDIDYSDKVVLRRFSIAEQRYSLMVICPQAVDERSEIELSLDPIASLLS